MARLIHLFVPHVVFDRELQSEVTTAEGPGVSHIFCSLVKQLDWILSVLNTRKVEDVGETVQYVYCEHSSSSECNRVRPNLDGHCGINIGKQTRTASGTRQVASS
jgi:hypothetical protein